MAAAMNGKWKLSSSEKFDEYMKELGMNSMFWRNLPSETFSYHLIEIVCRSTNGNTFELPLYNFYKWLFSLSPHPTSSRLPSSLATENPLELLPRPPISSMLFLNAFPTSLSSWSRSTSTLFRAWQTKLKKSCVLCHLVVIFGDKLIVVKGSQDSLLFIFGFCFIHSSQNQS